MKPQLKVDDEYETPPGAWELVLRYLPHHLIVWDPFYATGKAAKFIRKQGFSVIHRQKDFFEWEPTGYDVILTNPPYSKKKEVLERLLALSKPFAILVPLSIISTQYFVNMMKDRHFRLLIPTKRIHFLKNGEPTDRCSFDTCWLLYDMDAYVQVENQIVYVGGEE